ncbi:baseplate J/gp47 family protein [Sporosarcina sp. ANT_H38]|uniref:baseplate J/gp47 family protein n=1 Tax=Sporosarcina sp. ANT_H38 TaxID=2597358 RepID=UPI0011F3F063|nr:baseplate J/gp47 family protein [Sporosarcina sp. ANT_H38]KAA0944065.1 baseplate J/gp47 family protein [Sporosarcina sp. ANT_H38]
MFEHKTVAHIRDQALDEVANDVDKREGAIIFDSTAAVAVPMSEMYSNIDLVMQLTFADSSDGEYLERRIAEHGVYKKQASRAVRKGVFIGTDERPFNVPIGSRFGLNNLTYVVIEKIVDGEYRLRSEDFGVIGNQDYGELLPTEPLNDLGSAALTDVLVPGEIEETDESLYAKYLDHINEPAFGGNRADYKRKIMDIQGVGGVQLFRAPFGGGSVRAVIIDSTFNVPSPETVAFVQNKIDPLEGQGDGLGTAPIGHIVTIEAVEKLVVDIVATLSLVGVTLGQIEPLVIEIIDEYLAEVRSEWNKGFPLILRISHLESRILSLEGVQDILGTTFNGLATNITLPHEIPTKGSVVLNE